jgi:DNA-binding FadR family transcriptional regulator
MKAVEKALEGHIRIVEMLKAKDEKGLELALKDHLEYSKSSIHQAELSSCIQHETE